MKKEDIKRHLTTYSIFSKRKTTINHSFASAIAPSDSFDGKKLVEALSFLGQDSSTELVCVFCQEEGETWDHLTGLVKGGQLRGFGHQIGNLVPCCKKCNSQKGSKEFKTFISESPRIKPVRDELIKLLETYQVKFAVEIDLNNLEKNSPDDFKKYKGNFNVNAI